MYIVDLGKCSSTILFSLEMTDTVRRLANSKASKNTQG
jgi:hypothetical protein